MIYEKIESLIPRALKEKSENLGIYKLIKAELLKYKTGPRNSTAPLTEQEELEVLRGMAKERVDSIEKYTKAARKDLAEIEEKELLVIKSFLPAEPTDKEIQDYYDSLYKFRQENTGRELNLKDDMKPLLEELKKKFPDSPGKKLSGIVLESLKKK